MNKLLEWLKANVKDDADMNEATALVESLNEITPERASELIKDKEVRRHIDAEISRAVERHDEKFREEKLPKILDEERGKIRQELNPEETPQDKAVRELTEKLNRMEQEKATVERREQLRKKAQELGVDEIGLSPDDVDVFVNLGDNGAEQLESFVSKAKEAWKDSLDKQMKEKYSSGRRPQSGDSKTIDAMTLDEQMAYAKRGQKEMDEVLAYASQKQKSDRSK